MGVFPLVIYGVLIEVPLVSEMTQLIILVILTEAEQHQKTLDSGVKPLVRKREDEMQKERKKDREGKKTAEGAEG